MLNRSGPSLSALRSFALMAAVAIFAAACASSTPSSGGLASSQVLKFPVYQNPGTFDPAQADAEVDTEIMQNVFDNLWRFDNNLNIVPDIATRCRPRRIAASRRMV